MTDSADQSDEPSKKGQGVNWALGLPIGLGVGIAIGVGMDNIFTGIGIGIALSVAFGLALSAHKPTESGEGSAGGEDPDR